MTKLTHEEIARMGAYATHKLLTPEKRRKAAKKGWRLRKKKLSQAKK